MTCFPRSSSISDLGFVRSFRCHNRRNPPPLLGFFSQSVDDTAFQPTMEPPNRVPPDSFSMLSDDRSCFRPLGCRHGLMLVFDQKRIQVVVCDLVAEDHHRLAVPPGFDTSRTPIAGAVLLAVGDTHHFQVVLARSDKMQKQVFACIYSSETGVWSDHMSTLVPSGDSTYIVGMPAVLAADSVYWMLNGASGAILELDLGMQSLAVIHQPVVKFAIYEPRLMRAEGGGLGLLFLSDLTAQLWKRNTDCDGVASWVLGRTIFSRKRWEELLNWTSFFP